MPALIEGIRKDFPEVVTLELDLEGDGEGLKVLECGRMWSLLWGNVNNCEVRPFQGRQRPHEEVGKITLRSNLAI